MRLVKFIVFLLFLLIISGCATSTSKSFSSLNNNSSIQEGLFYGELIYSENKYILSNYIYLESDAIDIRDTKKWRFKIPSFDPAFNTKRFNCQKSNENLCAEWEGKENTFINVNRYKKPYGNTLLERRTIEEKKRGEETPIVGKIIAAPFIGAAYAVYSPLFIAAAILEITTDFPVNYWVEFNHEKFAEKIYSAIQASPYASTDGYLIKAAYAADVYSKAKELIIINQNKLESAQKEIATELSPYFVDNIEFSGYQVQPFKLPKKIDCSELNDLFRANLTDSINGHYENELLKQKSYFANYTPAIIASFIEKQKQDFNESIDKQSLIDFIETYEKNDRLGLVLKAKEKLSLMLKKEKIEREEIARQEELELKRVSKKLDQWRATLKNGDDTFCGPVIETSGAMVRLSLRVQLPGYANDLWLKRSEVYPQVAGCRNQNGRLYTSEWPPPSWAW